jgi:predicted ATPase
MAGCLSDDDYEDEDELWKEAEQQAREALANEYEEEYDCIRDEGDIEEVEKFLIGGVNAILSSLQDMLESVRQGKAARTEGGFDSAKIRFVNLGSNCAVAPSNMGIGFSQMMPLVASAFGSENSLIAIEQPELHVHPALQTELADLFIQSAKERKNRFLIETHSEHLILRLLRRVRETTEGTLEPDKCPIRPSDMCVLYVQPGDNGSEVIELPVTDDGDFAVPWPNGFFGERSIELF